MTEITGRVVDRFLERSASKKLEDILQPLVEGAEDPKWFLDTLIDEISDAAPDLTPALQQALLKATYKKDGQEIAYSDGQYGRHNDNLDFFFTLRFPSEVTVKAEVRVDVDVEKVLRSALRGEGIKPKGNVLASVLKELEGHLKEMVEGRLEEHTEHAGEDSRSPFSHEIVQNVTDIADQHLEQSIEAVGENGTVELGEYPTVHPAWQVGKAPIKWGKVQGSKGSYRIPFELSWPVGLRQWDSWTID